MAAITIVRQIVTLSKPRIVALLVFIAICGAWKASDGSPGAAELTVVIVGGILASAGSNAINQGLDADIDAIMKRTRQRPVPAEQMSAAVAVAAGTTLVVAAVVLMGVVANATAALLTAAASLVYVFVYTMALKRRSWNNIVIGGAAGAFPPLIGATAVTGEIDAVGVYMFAFVFFWTPPHFWTLSVLLRDDYSAANVPMLAAVASLRATSVQIVLYIVLLVAMAWLPLVAGYGGVTFGTVATILGAQWLRKSLHLFGEPTYAQTLSAYKYSLLYLAGVFLVFAAEPQIPWY
jgi:protoheme IX farnesyltransferase